MFYKNQIPLLALLSDKDYDEVDFYISNHDSACSSIFKFTNEINNSDVWSKRNYKMLKKIKLKSITLDTLLRNNNISAKDFDHWIIDLQGAALKGAENSLKSCKSIYIEVSKKIFYQNGCNWMM